MLSVFKSDKFEIKNSPVDRLATLGARALWCLKGACETAQPLGVTLGLMLSTDTILKEANRDPIFTPFLGGLLNQVLPDRGQPSISRMLESHLAKIQQNNVELEDIKKAVGSIENFTGGLSEEDASEFKQILLDNKTELIRNNNEIKSKIIEALNNKK